MKLSTTASLLLLALAAGCTTAPGDGGDVYFREGARAQAEAPTFATFERQAQQGARADATLYQAHFDNDALNSLGRQKLGRMLAATTDLRPLVVHLDGVEDGSPASDVRGGQVKRFAEDAGLGELVTVRAGASPTALAPAGKAVATLKSRWTTDAGAGGASAGGDAAAAAQGSGDYQPVGVTPGESEATPGDPTANVGE